MRKKTRDLRLKVSTEAIKSTTGALPRIPTDGIIHVENGAARVPYELACAAGYLRSLAIRQLASDRKYLAHFYMPV